MNKFLWIIGLLLNGFCHAQNVEVLAKTDKQDILIGDQFHLELSATFDPQKYWVQFPVIPDTIHRFECIQQEKLDTMTERNKSILHQRITWSHFDSGLWVLPSLPIRIQPKNGDSAYSVMTDSFLIKVNTIPVDTTKPFKPIMGIRSAKKPLTDYMKYIGWGLILAALLIALIWIGLKRYRKYRDQKNEKPEEPILTPFEKAIQDLEKLQSDAGYLRGEEKSYHTELTDILRRYLEQQFGIDCMEKTSTEIMQMVKKQKALANSRQSLRQVLETADIVKFAKATLSNEEHEQSMETALQLVRDSYKKFQQQITTDQVIS